MALRGPTKKVEWGQEKKYLESQIICKQQMLLHRSSRVGSRPPKEASELV